MNEEKEGGSVAFAVNDFFAAIKLCMEPFTTFKSISFLSGGEGRGGIKR